MRADIARLKSANVSSVALRFWSLVAVILALAIGSSAFALRLVALPYLERHQTQAVQEQALSAALRLDAWISREILLLEFVANDPNVLNIALGYAQSGDYFADLLEAMPTTQSLTWVTFYDAIGDPMARFEPDATARQLFAAADLEDLFLETVQEPIPQRRRALLVSERGVSHLAIAVPIVHNDLAEGVLLAGFRISLDEVFSNSDTIRAPVLMPDNMADAAPGAVEATRLNRLALTLAISPDVSTVQRAGNLLIARGTLAISAVLLGAFAVFAVLGRTVIVLPHVRLEEQAQRLKDQSHDLSELAAIAERANDAILVTDLEGAFIWANSSFERVTGHSRDSVIGLKPGDLLQGEGTDPKTIETLSRAIAERQAVQVEILNFGADGRPYWISLSISPLKSDEGETYGFVGISNDITEARQSREALLAAKLEIEHQALHDPLTGLPNRRALEDALLQRRDAGVEDTTVIRIDLDHFKYVNDTMGHEAGDFVLTSVAEILTEETKAEDLAVRVGGDEFVLLLRPGATEADGLQIAKRILARINTPKLFDDKTIRIGASFGVAGSGGMLLDRAALIIGADAALYEAKELGRNRVHLYTPHLHEKVLTRRELARELRHAMVQDELVPYFQTQVDAKTRQIVGVETLARWQSRAFGLVMPNRFLPVAQQLSIVEEIDHQIFHKAIAQTTALRDRGLDIPKLSVNVTAHRIKDRAVFDEVRALPHNAPRIAFEILESVLVEEQSTAFLMGLDTLREAGVEIEVDDFGSGHASIVGLMQLQPDAMKIDQRLVTPILQHPIALGMLERIVSMAELMDLRVVAEGVETAEHADLLTEIGCHVLQGFHFSEPMPIETLEQVLRGQADRSEAETHRRHG